MAVIEGSTPPEKLEALRIRFKAANGYAGGGGGGASFQALGVRVGKMLAAMVSPRLKCMHASIPAPLNKRLGEFIPDAHIKSLRSQGPNDYARTSSSHHTIAYTWCSIVL